MAADSRGVGRVYVAFAIGVDTPISIGALGVDYPDRFALWLGNVSPEVAVSTDNTTLARLRDVISAHLDSPAGEQ